jgi:hypothetical protein
MGEVSPLIFSVNIDRCVATPGGDRLGENKKGRRRWERMDEKAQKE